MADVEEMAAKVTEARMKEHEKRHHYQEKAPVAKYSNLWPERPFKLSEHRHATYYFPAEVQKRLGEDTYTLKIGERLYSDRHHSQMNPRAPDPTGKHVQFDYADLEVDKDSPFTEEHE